MSYPLSEIISFLETWAPPELAEKWDSIGLQIGDSKQFIQSVHISLDVDKQAVEQLQARPVDLVITHHPLFFKPLSQLNFNDDMGQILTLFLNQKINLYSMHTNLDATKDGVNDALMRQYGIEPELTLPISNGFGSYLECQVSKEDLVSKFPVQVQGDTTKTQFNRIGFCAGSGHGFIRNIIDLNIECFITGEITYHDHVYCEMNGITVLTLGHKESEQAIIPVIKTHLESGFPELDITCSSL